MYYIETNIVEYTEIVTDDEMFNIEETIRVLLLDVADEYKVKLLGQIKSPLTAQNQRYSDAVRAHILRNNLECGDISHFTEEYPNEGILTKQATVSMVTDNIDNVFETDCTIAIELFDDIQASTKNLVEVVQPVFACLVKSLDETLCRQYLMQLGLNDYDSLFERKRPKILKDPISERILTVFRNKHWINIFEIYKDDENYYRAYGRKTQLDASEIEDKTEKMIQMD